MSPARFRWGLILVQIGILILLRNMDVLSDNFWEDLLVWSPVILIAVGIEKIFTRSRLQFISYLSSIALFFAGFAIAFNSGYYDRGGSFFSEYTYSIDHDSKIRQMKAVLDLRQSDLTIRDSGGDLFYSRFPKYSRKPDVDRVTENDHLTLRITGQRNQYLGGAVKIDDGLHDDWYLKFSRDVPLELECNAHESDIHLNMATTPLKKLDLDADEARIYLKLGDLMPLVLVKIEGDDTNLRLRVPNNVGIRIFGKDYASYLERIGFVENNGSFINVTFDESDSKIEVNLDDRLGSFSLDFF